MAVSRGCRGGAVVVDLVAWRNCSSKTSPPCTQRGALKRGSSAVRLTPVCTHAFFSQISTVGCGDRGRTSSKGAQQDSTIFTCVCGNTPRRVVRKREDHFRRVPEQNRTVNLCSLAWQDFPNLKIRAGKAIELKHTLAFNKLWCKKLNHVLALMYPMLCHLDLIGFRRSRDRVVCSNSYACLFIKIVPGAVDETAPCLNRHLYQRSLSCTSTSGTLLVIL